MLNARSFHIITGAWERIKVTVSDSEYFSNVINASLI